MQISLKPMFSGNHYVGGGPGGGRRKLRVRGNGGRTPEGNRSPNYARRSTYVYLPSWNDPYGDHAEAARFLTQYPKNEPIITVTVSHGSPFAFTLTPEVRTKQAITLLPLGPEVKLVPFQKN